MGAYEELLVEINDSTKDGFAEATRRLISYVDKLDKEKLSEILLDIGAIPQEILPSSTEEKVYSKATDIVLAKSFGELGLSSEILEARGNSADIVAKSELHGYSLVADAKSMRLSRTAKNQKDFKVGALGDSWIGDENYYAVLCCPLYQYPNTASQIYEQALNNKTCFISWEHLKFLLDNNVKETETYSLEPIWAYMTRLSRTTTSDRKNNFFDKVNINICQRLNCDVKELYDSIKSYNKHIVVRAKKEQEKIVGEQIAKIKSLSYEEAISLLIEAEEKKTDTITKLVNRLEKEDENELH